MSEFKAFKKIEHIGKLYMSITEKLHGSNAQIYIYPRFAYGIDTELLLKVGSRTRWLVPGDDNFGFAKFVYDNKEEFIAKLGEGRHFGEWIGTGINGGMGLKEKFFCLFDWWRWQDKELPINTQVVPVLYNGIASLAVIDETMAKLKETGSQLVPGYMNPEGIVINIAGQLFKKVFDNEEVKWKGVKTERIVFDKIDVDYLLQPIRLEKLLSRDESYIREYPRSIKQICSDYVADLEEEKQFKSMTEDELKGEKKALGSSVFHFIKSVIKEKYNL